MICTAHKYYSGDQIESMRWAGHVACVGGGEVHTGFCWGDLRERDYLYDIGVDGIVILKWVFKKWVGGLGLDSPDSG